MRRRPGATRDYPLRPYPTLLRSTPVIEGVERAYTPCVEAVPDHGNLTDAIYEPYALHSIRIPGAKPHPTPLVQSSSMASVPPPVPSYRPSDRKSTRLNSSH